MIQPIKEKLLKIEHVQLNKWANDLKDNSVFIERVNQILCKDAPVVIGKGPVIKEGFHSELDKLRLLLSDAKAVLLEIQNREIKNTGITSLKIAFNNIFGYYIEVRNTHKDKVPSNWIRKQTLTAAERYVTEELKIYEEKILGAEEKIFKLEHEIFSDLIQELITKIEPIVFNAKCIAYLDVLHGLSQVSISNNYVKPTVNNSKKLAITRQTRCY